MQFIDQIMSSGEKSELNIGIAPYPAHTSFDDNKTCSRSDLMTAYIFVAITVDASLAQWKKIMITAVPKTTTTSTSL